MRRYAAWIAMLAAVAATAAHRTVAECGTTIDTPQQALFLHRQALRGRAARIHPLDVAPLSGNRDIGNISLIEDSNGVVERQNQFNLDHNSLTFTPAGSNASNYRYSTAPQGYDFTAANGSPLVALDDDDTRQIGLPFPFPYFGKLYTQTFVNSDGNLTFGVGDLTSTDRSLGRLTAGPPRIAPFFDDLDPSKTAGGVRVFSDSAHVVISWVNVPEYSQFSSGYPEQFQVALYSNGRIQFSYNGIGSGSSAVVGIAPGNLQGATSIVDYRSDPTGNYSAAVAEVFGNSIALDIVTVAQQFYQTHDDSYDYLVIYNNMNIPSLGDAVAYETTVRSSGTGYNVPMQDSGAEYGSASRLQSVLNMGQLTEYPVNPNGPVPARAGTGDTPLTILAHETGHLFLAFASIPGAADAPAQPMLGYQLAHWNFAYDSEASVLEGERIIDQGAGASPRFLTTATVQGYSPLDQYLMGFRAPGAVPDTFVVTNTTTNGFPLDTANLHPVSGVSFNGTRQNVTIDNMIQAQGRRNPDDTVAQRRFRFAFILVVPQGSQPSSDDLSQIDTYRQQFETFFGAASSGNAVADTSLRRSVKISLFPAAGVVAGASASGSIALQTAPAADLTVQLQTAGGHATFPPSVTIPAGATNASFNFTGTNAGVDQVSGVPSDASYETVAARVQVADASLLKLVAVSGDQQISTSLARLPDPIVVALTDVNGLPYAGARIDAVPSADGVAVPTVALTDAQGHASFQWTPGPASSNQLRLTVDAQPSVGLTIRAGKAVPVITAVVNAASFATGIAQGAFATVFGQNLTSNQPAQSTYPWPPTLAGTQVTLNGALVPLLYASSTQINFYVPPATTTGSASLAVITSAAGADTVSVNVSAVQPGIFAGAILHAGTAVSAVTTAVHAGDYIEIYGTGLGATAVIPTVFIGDIPLQPVYAGPSPGFVGLYQVDVQIPPGLAPGTRPVILEANLQHSNVVNILVQ